MENSPNRALAVQLLSQAVNLIRGMEQGQLANLTISSPRNAGPSNSSSLTSTVPLTPVTSNTFASSGFRNTPGVVGAVAPQTAQFRLTSRPSTPVLSEMRQQFSPYSTSGRRRGNTSRLGSSPSSMVNLQLFCLGGPRDTMTPDIERKSLLMALDLAQGVVTIARGATSAELESGIRAEYPRLENIDFEVLRAISHGSRKPLQRISRSCSIPTPAVVKDLRVTVAYVRPLENIVPAESETETEENSDNGSPTEDQPIVRPPTRSTFQQLFGSPSSLANSARSSLAGSSAANSQAGGFHFPIEIDTDVSDMTDEVTHYRESLFQANKGREMVMISSRENILKELLGVYKNPTFNFKKKTWVIFAGEDGRDVNGLTKEFFSVGISALQSGKIGNHPFFEGQLDHLLPTCDPFLLNARYFKVLGKFMAHAAVHVGIGFIGLSAAVVKYLFQKNCNEDEVFIECSIEDIPDLEIRLAAQQMQEWTNSQAPPSLEIIRNVTTALEEAQIFEAPKSENILFLFQQYLMWSTILCRATFLNEIRDGIKSTGFMEFLLEKEHLLVKLFPTDVSLNYTAFDVLSKVTYIGDDIENIRRIFEAIIESLDSVMIRKLLQCWTGFPVIPSDGLCVKGSSNVAFVIHTCFNQIEVPTGITSVELRTSILQAIEYCTFGFGSV